MSTDYGKLIEEARRAETAVYLAAPDSVAADLARIIRGLADAVEVLVAELEHVDSIAQVNALNMSDFVAMREQRDEARAENDRLRRNREDQAAQWGVRVSAPRQGWIERMRTREECERWIANPPLRYWHQVGESFAIVKRLAAGPWVEVEGDKSNE
jgi:hypothetical protein